MTVTARDVIAEQTLVHRRRRIALVAARYALSMGDVHADEQGLIEQAERDLRAFLGGYLYAHLGVTEMSKEPDLATLEGKARARALMRRILAVATEHADFARTGDPAAITLLEATGEQMRVVPNWLDAFTRALELHPDLADAASRS